jgi:hypothetical protein
MAKNSKAEPKSNLPEGYVPLRAARSAGFLIFAKGNNFEGILRDKFQVDNNFKKGEKKTVFKIELTEEGTRIVDAETKEERVADVGEVIGIDETGYLRALQDVEPGTRVVGINLGMQDAKQVKAGRKPAWIFELGRVPF